MAKKGRRYSAYGAKAMKPGPAPKPNAMKQLEGNPGGRRLKDNPEYEAVSAQTLMPPKFLDDLAVLKWRSLAPDLSKSGILTEVDMDAFAAYCVAYSRWVKAEELVLEMAKFDSKGKGLLIKGERGRPVQNPAVRTAQSAMDSMVKLAQQFGITPASRNGIDVTGKEKDNPFDEILNAKPN